MGSNRTGRTGRDTVLTVPPGTQILDTEDNALLADLTLPGHRVVLLRGGRGGRGNTRFKTSTNRAPRHSDPGEPGAELWIRLQLKLIADAGLVGLPNAGKSTFLSAVSGARPKVADYPFTTLSPVLGVVRIDDAEFVLADIPGLIEGAHEGIGLGDRFLGHVERCSTLLHLVDGTEDDPAASWRVVREELEKYGHGLVEKTEIVAMSKLDAIPGEDRIERRSALEKACNGKVACLSAVSGEGMTELLRLVSGTINPVREDSSWTP